MKMLALLSAANIAALPAASLHVAAVTVLALGVVWLAWPLLGLLK